MWVQVSLHEADIDMMQLTLTKADDGDWELDLDGQVTFSTDLKGLKELRDLLDKAIESESVVTL